MRKSIPFIVMTSTDQKENLLEMVKAGANDYIEKPFQGMVHGAAGIFPARTAKVEIDKDGYQKEAVNEG